MTQGGWKQLFVDAVQKDGEQLNRLALMLERYDQGMQALRDRGYGVTGMDLLATVQEMQKEQL